jgi:hypothetical protein
MVSLLYAAKPGCVMKITNPRANEMRFGTAKADLRKKQAGSDSICTIFYKIDDFCQKGLHQNVSGV